MPNLLCTLRRNFKSLEFNLLTLKLNLQNVYSERPTEEHVYKQEPTGIPEHVLEGAVGAQHLEHIIAQVKVEGFHVESLAIFRCGNLKPSDSLLSIQRWAASVGLKVSFNHEHALCFFEES